MLTHGNIIANTAAFLKTTEVNVHSSKIWSMYKYPLYKTSDQSRRRDKKIIGMSEMHFISRIITVNNHECVSIRMAAVTTTQTDEGSWYAKSDTSHKHQTLFCCGFYMVFGNQFIVAMGYPAVRVGLQAALRFSGNDRLDYVGLHKHCNITALILTLCWPNKFSIQGILSFLRQIHAWPRLRQYCVNISPHAYVRIEQETCALLHYGVETHLTLPTFCPLQKDCMLCVHDVHISYLPLAHMLERVIHVSNEEKLSLQWL